MAMVHEGPQGEQGEQGERGRPGPRGAEGVLPEDFMERFDAAVESVDRLYDEIAAENQVRREENIKRDKRIRTNKRWNRGVMVLAVLAILVGIRGVRLQHEANEDRKQRTIAACEQANDQIDRTRVAFDKHDEKWASLLAPGPRTPSVQGRVDRALAALHADTIRNNPHRDCSPEGLKRYYSATTTTTKT